MRLVKLIGRNVKRRREGRGWTQAELAAKIRIHRISLARLEAGGKGPSWALVERLARALRVKPSRLLE